MYDALTIAALVDELSATIVDGRIQRVQHLDKRTIGFEVYARHERQWLVISADNDNARMLLHSSRGGGDPEMMTPLLLLLRKHARGARIAAISQPRHERIVVISIARPILDDLDDDGDRADIEIEYEHHEIVVELMGRHSNILLVNSDGTIRDAIKRVTPEMSRVRQIQPNQSYEPPPPQSKLDPTTVTASDLHNSAKGSEQRLDRWLVSALLSVSPMLAREIMHRAGMDTDHKPAELEESGLEALAIAIRELFEPLDSGEWSPHVYDFDSGGAEFSAVRLEHLAGREDVTERATMTTMEAALHAWESGVAITTDDRHAARRERILDQIRDARERLQNRVDGLKRQQERTSDPETLRLKGEMIYAYVWMIEPGTKEITTPDGLTIALDPDMTPSENAQEYFEQYRKAQSAAASLPSLIAGTEKQIEYLDQLSTMAEQAESYDEVEAIRLEWEEAQTNVLGAGRDAEDSRKKKSRKSFRKPRQYRTEHGDLLWIGRTSSQNDQVTFEIANQNDLWLHARDMPGSHIILRPADSEPVEKLVERAAALAAYYSKGRGATRVPVDVTERRHVRKIKGAGPGMVTYRNERTLSVEPQSETQLGLTAAD